MPPHKNQIISSYLQVNHQGQTGKTHRVTVFKYSYLIECNTQSPIPLPECGIWHEYHRILGILTQACVLLGPL